MLFLLYCLFALSYAYLHITHQTQTDTIISVNDYSFIHNNNTAQNILNVSLLKRPYLM